MKPQLNVSVMLLTADSESTALGKMLSCTRPDSDAAPVVLWEVLSPPSKAEAEPELMPRQQTVGNPLP